MVCSIATHARGNPTRTTRPGISLESIGHRGGIKDSLASISAAPGVIGPDALRLNKANEAKTGYIVQECPFLLRRTLSLFLYLPKNV